MPKSCKLSVSTSESGAPTKWFAAYTATNHEKYVQSHLADRQVDTFLPLYTVNRQWKKRAPEVATLPLFPNYIFIRISPAERGAVLGTPGVYSIIGTSREAWELPDREIEALRCGIQERLVEPHPYLNVGEKARIKYGPLAGLEGVIVRKKNNLNIVISLDRIMQSVAIEVNANELESAPNSHVC